MLIQVLSSTVTIDLASLGWGLLALAGVAVLIILAIVLTKLVGTVSRLNHMLDEITPEIKTTVSKLPETIQNVNSISGNVVDLTDDIVSELPAILNSVSTVSSTSAELVESGARVIDEVTSIIVAVLKFIKRPLASASVVRDLMHTASKLKKKGKRKMK